MRLKKIQIIGIFAVGMLGGLTKLASRLSRRMKSSTAIVALVAAAVLAGHAVSAQVAPPSPPPSLKTVKVPEPDNIGDFVKDKVAAIALGKSLFWDMQLGTDGIQSCASCHFHAGADNRSKNQINPGKGNIFNIGGGPNYQLAVADYPFHKLADPNNNSSTVVSDSSDITGSQGVFRSDFVDINPGNAQDIVTPIKDNVFNVQGTNVRQVTNRNTPTVINAVFNFRNFWDGRAQNIFNGVDVFGSRNSSALVLKATNPNRLEDVPVKLNNASLASQAVGPPDNSLETAAEKLPISPSLVTLSPTDNTVTVSDTNGNNVSSNSADLESSTATVSEPNNQNASASPDSSSRRPPAPTTTINRIGRKLGKKLLALRPLNKQLVAKDDSVLGSLSRLPEQGLNQSYESLIQAAFKPEWWNSDLIVRVDPNTGERSYFRKPRNRPLSTIEYTLMEYNFSLFFGLAIQAYESTLVANDTPFDQFQDGNKSALTAQQQAGLNLFLSKGCIGCHGGPEFTTAAVENVASNGRIERTPPFVKSLAHDTGFFNIGVRPQQEDSGVGGLDPNNNSLSETRLAQQGKFNQIFGENPPTLNPALNSSEPVIADGAFKVPGLRNVELTAPYFHNGGQLTLREVVDFYNRGGDFTSPTNILGPLGLTDDEKEQLVAFLQALTDERVRYQKAPFDHPQLFVPNGHPGDQNAVASDPNVQIQDGTKQAVDALLEMPAVGRNGGNPMANFLGTYPR